jgi:hypothetical protein
MGNTWLRAGARTLLAGAGLFVVGAVVGCTGPEKTIESRPINSNSTAKGFGPSAGAPGSTIPGTAGASSTAGAGLSARAPLQQTTTGPRPALNTFDTGPRGSQAVGMSTPTNPTFTQPTYPSQPSTGAVPASSSQSQRITMPGAALPSGTGSSPSTASTAGTTNWGSTPIATSGQSSPAIATRTSTPPAPMPHDFGETTMPPPAVAQPKAIAVSPAVYNNEVPPPPTPVPVISPVGGAYPIK